MMKNHSFLNAPDWNLFETKSKNLIPLKNILENDYNSFEFEDEEYKGTPTGQAFMDEDGDIIDFQPITLEEHPTRLKYKVSNTNILISSLRLAKSPASLLVNNDLQKQFSLTAFIFSK
ncbi:MAG: hypothetical protein LBS81_06535 [Endomicrobium sp.]|jgi:type I restriction enzyme S subunit|nr:hypothetical protein [Endomicrobium sp.]